MDIRLRHTFLDCSEKYDDDTPSSMVISEISNNNQIVYFTQLHGEKIHEDQLHKVELLTTAVCNNCELCLSGCLISKSNLPIFGRGNDRHTAVCPNWNQKT